jgi:hypothetical protein
MQQQHAALQPVFAALLAAYPEHLKEQQFSMDSFMWAAQLWYAYAMQVSAGAVDARGGGAACASTCIVCAHVAASVSSLAVWPAGSRGCCPTAQVQGVDGEVAPALVPYACLINHSARPHIVRFSKLDPATGLYRCACV